MATMKRMCPGASVEEVAQRFAQDKDFNFCFNRGRTAIEEETNDASILPTFVPASEVEKTHSYGFCVYEKCGLLPESQIVSLTGKSPQQLNMEKWTSETL